jgi:hypothetical protein
MNYIDLSPNPVERIIDGKLGFSLLYKVKRVMCNGAAIDMTYSDVYYSREFGGLCSVRSANAKAKQLQINKYGKYTLREKLSGAKAFTRPFMVHADEVEYAARQIFN